MQGNQIPDGRYVYLEMFFPTNSVSPGTYNWSNSGAAGTFSGLSDISMVENGSHSFDRVIGGAVTISRSGTNYTISGTVTTTRGEATFSFAGPLASIGDGNGDGGRILNYGGTDTALEYAFSDKFNFLGNPNGFDLFFSPSAVHPLMQVDQIPDGRYLYLEMFFPTNSVSPGTYNWSDSGAVGTFSGLSDISRVENGSVFYDAIIGGTVTITRSGTDYIIRGTVTTTRGEATFSYAGPLTSIGDVPSVPVDPGGPSAPVDPGTPGFGILGYQGTFSQLHYLYFEHWGLVGDAYNISVLIPHNWLRHNEFPPDGRWVYLEMFFPSNSVTPGTYVWSNTEAPGTFSGDSGIAFSDGVLITGDFLTGGSITIERTGDIFTISGTVNTTNGTATFSYFGPLTGQDFF